MNRKFLPVFAALLAVTAVMIVPAMAQAVTLKKEGVEVLTTGTGVRLESSNNVYTWSNGIKSECDVLLLGKVTTNKAPIAKIEITTAYFHPPTGGEANEPCPMNFGGYYDYVSGLNLPWHLSLTAGHTALNDMAQRHNGGYATEEWPSANEFKTNSFEGTFKYESPLSLTMEGNFYNYGEGGSYAQSYSEFLQFSVTTATGSYVTAS